MRRGGGGCACLAIGQPRRIMVIGDRPAKPMRNLDPFAWQVSHLTEPAVDLEALVAQVEDLRQRIFAADPDFRSMLPETIPHGSSG